MTIPQTVSFEDTFEHIAQDIISEVEALDFPKDAVDYLRRMLFYTVPGGKMNRGLSVYHTYQLIMTAKGQEFTTQATFKANVLGWCVEILQAFFLVADDIMDHSKTRRGQPCWYLNKEVGNMAINDSFILESVIYRLLRKYFRQDACYGMLLELFHDTTYRTELGQLLDLLTAPEDPVQSDLSRFTDERYVKIVQYKTAYYSFYLPVALAMSMAGIVDDAVYSQAMDILVPLGVFFQVQDDYLDCYGDPQVIGKIGTDIQDNKCSWLVVQAVKLCNPEQLNLLKDKYGKKNDECEQSVKKLYSQLDLESVYRQYEEKSHGEIIAMINRVDEDQVPRAVFLDFTKRIYKRMK
ncbi:hypothetical protein MP228_009258 [Amoeboaphelidium protococcarum]|nr:hypothetical protein MP228_009258 [Amoeboaphelidium protococcarum]